MASCNLATLQADACANGFLDLSEKQAGAASLQYFANIIGNTLTLEQLLAQACSNEFHLASEKQAIAAELQLVCNMTDGLIADAVDCVNLIPDGAMYGDQDIEAAYYLSGFGSNILTVGNTYILTWGSNESMLQNGAGVTFSPGTGLTTIFTAEQPCDLISVGLVNNIPVTAVICEV